MSPVDAGTHLLAVMLSSTHQRASGQALPQETAEAFGLALLCALQDHCCHVSRATQVWVRLAGVEDSEGLYLVAGDAEHETVTYTPVPHLVRALLLRQPEAPQLGFTAAWQAVPPGLTALDYRARLRRFPWRRDLDAYIVFLALTHRHIRAGLSPNHAQQEVARQLAHDLNLTIVTDGQLHTPGDPQTADPSLLN